MSQQQHPQEETVRRRRRRRRGSSHTCLVTVMYVAFILGVSMFLSAFAILCANDVFAFVKPDRAAVVEITAEDDAESVGAKLEEAGVINYKTLFALYARLSKEEDRFKTGKYELNANLDYSAIARNLRRTSTYKETVRVTVPEGYTTRQIIELLVEKSVCSEEDLWEAVKNGSFNYTFLYGAKKGSETRLEGYLFPDTYEFYINDKATSVIGKFLQNFDNKLTDEMRADLEDSGMTMTELVTIASLVEREAKKDEERPVISSVIHNRLDNAKAYPYLQIDATVQYLTGRVPTADDLKIDSPYNTYLYSGLPPTAIANPGIASIKAALYPEDTAYYYYVAKDDGSHIFSKTLDEHNAAIASLKK